jgi:hypothetical protein
MVSSGVDVDPNCHVSAPGGADAYELITVALATRAFIPGGKVVNFYLNAKKVAGRRLLHWPVSPYQVREFCMSYVPGAPIASPWR